MLASEPTLLKIRGSMTSTRITKPIGPRLSICLAMPSFKTPWLLCPLPIRQALYAPYLAMLERTKIWTSARVNSRPHVLWEVENIHKCPRKLRWRPPKRRDVLWWQRKRSIRVSGKYHIYLHRSWGSVRIYQINTILKFLQLIISHHIVHTWVKSPSKSLEFSGFFLKDHLDFFLEF